LIRFLIIFGLCFHSAQVNAKEKTYITFKKKNSNRQFRLELPLKCRLFEFEKEKIFGKIIDYNDSTVLFEYKDYDTAEVNQIMALENLSRKERFDLIDTLIQDSKYSRSISQDQISKLVVLSGSDTPIREWSMLGSAVLFMGSGIALLIDRSNSVGFKMQWWNWLQLSGLGAGAGSLAILMKRTIALDKWQIMQNLSPSK
jgi:hypothetical protein